MLCNIIHLFLYKDFLENKFTSEKLLLIWMPIKESDSSSNVNEIWKMADLRKATYNEHKIRCTFKNTVESRSNDLITYKVLAQQQQQQQRASLPHTGTISVAAAKSQPKYSLDSMPEVKLIKRKFSEPDNLDSTDSSVIILHSNLFLNNWLNLKFLFIFFCKKSLVSNPNQWIHPIQ